MGKNKRKRSHTKHVFVQKKYRDALFRRIFNEKPYAMGDPYEQIGEYHCQEH